jgi:carboxyl-terminal processing protease
MMHHARITLVAVVLAAALGAGGWELAQGFRVRDAGMNVRLFDQVLEHVADRYVDPIDVGTLYTRAATGLVRELGDPHSVYLDSSRLARAQQLATGSFGGLGIDFDVRDGNVNILAAAPGSPAEQAGLRAGDRILAIDGRTVVNWTAEEMRRALRGNPGTTVTLTIERLGTGIRTQLTLERERVYARPVQRAVLLDDGIGYVSLRSFSDSAAIELEAAVDSLHHQGMRALILDLRGNPGGLLSQGTEVAELFLDRGQTIVSLRGRGPEGHRDHVAQRDQRWPDMRLAVLVDRGSASAAEIVAGALQDHDRALVVGRPSYGKGSAQSIFSFAHEAAGVKLTTSRWYTPSGRNIDLDVAIASDPIGASIGDTTSRPAFRTDSGRVVYGGGGIVPDIITADPASMSAPSRALLAATGDKVRTFRAVINEEAKRISASGVSSPLFDVTPAMRDALYDRLRSAGIVIDRTIYNRGSELVDRWLGGEATRLAFGRAAEARRITLRDRTVQDAMTRLHAARNTRDLLAAATRDAAAAKSQ